MGLLAVVQLAASLSHHIFSLNSCTSSMISKLNGEMAFFQVLRCGGGSFGDGIQGEGKALPAQAGFSQNAFRDLFPKTVRDAIAAWISSADFFVVESTMGTAGKCCEHYQLLSREP
jgi:hypothetical protein